MVKNVLPKPTQLDHLSKAYKNEVTGKQLTFEFIDELLHYKTKKKERRDLAKKLFDAGLSEHLEDAEELKELITKLIMKYQHYNSAQKIITLLLAEVESIFNVEIKPKLHPQITMVEVKALIRTCIEIEISEKLGENVLEIYNRQINGMVFYLTGNCHLEWDDASL
ncbi:ABC-three component system protein [Shewanella submarina]